MNKARLLKLANLLDKVPARKFDMGWWGESRLPVEENTPRCITKACALGWATAVPEFHKAGLELVARRGSTQAHVRFGSHYDREAAMAFFDIDRTEAYRLFFQGGDTAKDKAEEIRSMVRAA